MRYVQGKGSLRTRFYESHQNRNNEQFPDYFGHNAGRGGGGGILLLQFLLLYSAALHLSNQRSRGLTSLSKRREEKEEKNRATAVSFCLYSHSNVHFARIRYRHRRNSRSNENEITYCLNILRDTPGKFSTPFIVSSFPFERRSEEESLGRREKSQSRIWGKMSIVLLFCIYLHSSI